MTVYLDMCALQRPYDDRSIARNAVEAEAILRLFELQQRGGLMVVASTPLLFEAVRNPGRNRRRKVLEVLAAAAMIRPDPDAVERFALEYGANGIRPLDAVHLASAVEFGVDFFCTCDDALLRSARRADVRTTRVVSPLELVLELTDEGQPDA